MKRSRHRYIALFLGEDLDQHNQARTGIVQYARPNHPWRFAHLPRELEGLLKIRNQGWDGGIANFDDARRVAAVRRFGIPVVNIYGGRVSWGLPQVGADNQDIGRVGAEYFLQKGFTTLAFYGLAGSGYPLGRWIGFRNAAKARECQLSRFMAIDAREFEKGIQGGIGLARWLSGLPKPAGILTCDALRGICLTEACYSLGLRIPDDVAILCVSSDELKCQSAFPPLSSISLPEEKCGYLAAKMLDDLLAGRSIQPRVLLAPGPIIERMSTDIQHVPDPAVAKALALIREHATHGLRPNALARQTGVCRRVLERKFRRLLGCSPYAEIRMVQIGKAKELLATSNSTLETIAHQVGLGSGIHLSHEFKKRTGQTPGQYRKQFRLL